MTDFFQKHVMIDYLMFMRVTRNFIENKINPKYIWNIHLIGSKSEELLKI